MTITITVLAYHGANVFGSDYHNNDNIAFESDLKVIKENGIKIISSFTLVDYLYGNIELDDNGKYVVITFDDGTDLDYVDSQYPGFGFQSSFYSRMIEFDGYIHATSFVIASPLARKMIEKECLNSYHLLSEDWWQSAIDSGIFTIGNHSWDHVHATLDTVVQHDNIKGDFTQIKTIEDADGQIDASNQYIANVLNGQTPSLFAYPFGHYNDFLTHNYFPKQQTTIKAAFTCEPQYVNQQTNVWKIPRFVCGHHWKNRQQFKQLITGEFKYGK